MMSPPKGGRSFEVKFRGKEYIIIYPIETNPCIDRLTPQHQKKRRQDDEKKTHLYFIQGRSRCRRE